MTKTAQAPIFRPPETLRKFMLDNSFVRGVMGPIGSGKSSACAVELCRRSVEMPPFRDGVRRSRWAVIRNTYRELQDTTVKTWLEWFPEDKCGPFNKQDMAHRATFGQGIESEVLFRALDKPDDIKKLLSLELTGAWLNEAREIPLQVLEMLEGRVDRYPRKIDVPKYWAGIIMDTNPPDDDHWWYRLAEELTPELRALRRKRWRNWFEALEELYRVLGVSGGGEVTSAEEAKEKFDQLSGKYRFFRQPSGLSADAENVENLGKNYYTRISIGKAPEWVNVYVHGNYGIVMDGKPVFPEYNDSIHYNELLTKPLRGVRILRGWDFGRTPAITLSQLSARGQWLVFDEVVSKDMGIDAFGDYVKKYCGENYTGYEFVDYCDPSGFFKGDKDDRTCAQILMGKGIDVEGGIQTPRIRIECVSKALRGLVDGKPEFQLGPKCRTLRKGFMGGYCYRRMQVSGERYTDQPDKNEYSHAMDSLQYVGTMLYRSDLLAPEPKVDDGEWVESAWTESGRSAVGGY